MGSRTFQTTWATARSAGCSLAARALLVELLPAIAMLDGYLLVAGVVPSDAALAHRTQVSTIVEIAAPALRAGVGARGRPPRRRVAAAAARGKARRMTKRGRRGGVTPAAPSGDAYLPLTALARYAGLSVRTLRAYLRDRTRPLPHYRIGGKILVRQSEYDAWVAQFRATAAAVSVESLVDDVIRGMA